MDSELSRMQQLVSNLNRASEAYYNGKPELMTDYEWDAAFDELRRLETSTGQVLPDSPTQRVSEDNTAGEKEAHEFPALSLAKTKRTEELVKWAGGRAIWVSWKLDGLTLVVTYDHGKLEKVVTRGNGHVGTNITHLAHAISGIPQNVSNQGRIVVRGEAVISYDDFNTFLVETDGDYANPRNLASGSLSLKDPEEVKRRMIRFIPFTLVSYLPPTGDQNPANLASWGKRLDWLDGLGFDTVGRELVAQPTEEHVQAAIDHFTESLPSFPYPADGLVVTYDDTEFASGGSITGHHATRAGLAFKWQDEAAETELAEVEWSCAASTITPVAIFRPVQLEGTTVRRASLCNISECLRLGIGGPGTRIAVIKANKIIPKVVRVLEPVGTLDIPAECPVCHHATQIADSAASGTRTLHCTNPSCPAKQLRKYARFVSKAGMDIDGISQQTLARFVNLGWITDFSDIYRLSEHTIEMAALEGFGQRSATNIIKSVEKARKADAARLIIALGIPKCGPDVAKRLLGAYPFEQLVAIATTTDTPECFADISGIGPERSRLFVEWFRDGSNQAAFQRLMSQIEVHQAQQKAAGERCQGLTFVITGDVNHYSNRNELKAYIESQGGRVASAVSGSTSFLINNNPASASSKNKKARELGIAIITEDEFLNRFAAEIESSADDKGESASGKTAPSTAEVTPSTAGVTPSTAGVTPSDDISKPSASKDTPQLTLDF